ncbi:MAG: hypothetical protein JSR91_05035 [Proteobacteria bacterium]|nr:hypothetical protein [Pseudomonadota bacterium]
MARVRSPNYPGISLPEAIARIGHIHAKEQHLPATREVLAKHMGYNGINGASLKVLSALSKYGLLEEVNGDKMRVSSLAMSILYPANDVEKGRSIRDAAFRPPLFTEMREEWGEASPSDANMRSYLVRRSFATDAIDRVIESYRDTMELVSRSATEFNPVPAPASVTDDMPMSASSRMITAPAPTAAPMQSMSLTENTLRVSMTDSGLEVHAGLVDVEGVDRLIKILEANKLLLPAAKPQGAAAV